MRVSIRHTTHYRYDAVGSFAVQRLRLTPFDNPAQRILSWVIEADGIADAAQYVDGFGNRVHLITHSKPYDELTISAFGELDTVDTGGILGSLGELADPRLFLRATPLTKSSAGIDGLSQELPGKDSLDRLHHLLEVIADKVAYVTDATGSGTSAVEAFEAGQGVCQDHAHIFIAAARRREIPARRHRLHASGASSRRSPCLGGSLDCRPWLGRFRSGQPYFDGALRPPRLRLRCGRRGADHRDAARWRPN
jgi:transglutaminase-like putative cysteine protease